jgi:hypothetical protein
MEFIPICSECNNFQTGDKCPYYSEIPFAIKIREVRCDHYSGNDPDYILFEDDLQNGTGKEANS